MPRPIDRTDTVTVASQFTEFEQHLREEHDLTAHKPTNNAAAAELSKRPVMDRCVEKFAIKREEGTETLERRYNEYANDTANGLSNMERDLLRLQANDPFLVNPKEIRDYTLTKNIYSKSTNTDTDARIKSRFQLCFSSYKQLAELEKFLAELRNAPVTRNTADRYNRELIKLFNAVATGEHSLHIDPKTAQEYREFFERQIAELGKNTNAKDENEVTEFRLRQLAIENYYIYYVLPKELMRYGLVMGPSYFVTQGRTKQLRYLGIVMPSLSEKILNNVPAYQKTAQEYGIPIQVYDSANATIDRRIQQTSFSGGLVNINLLALEAEIANELISARSWQQRFDMAYKENPDFKFEQDPRFLEQLLLLGFHGAKSNEDDARTKILNANLEEQIAAGLSQIYLENIYRQEMQNNDETLDPENETSFWAGLAQGRRDNVSALFKSKSTSTLKDAYDKIEQALNIGDVTIESMDASNVRRGLLQILNLEGRLRALAKSQDPSYLLVKSLRNVILPMQQEHRTHTTSKKAGHYGAEVILTKLLTEKLLGDEGMKLCQEVNWDELFKMDFTNFETYSYQNFLKNPNDPKNDPHGLMKLRQAWYRYFDRELGGSKYLENFGRFVKSNKVQDAARSLIKREFTSYEDRKMRDQVAYYRKHMGFYFPTGSES